MYHVSFPHMCNISSESSCFVEVILLTIQTLPSW